MAENRKNFFSRLLEPFTEMFGFSRAAALLSVVLLCLLIVFAIFWFFHSAPPRTITITSGVPGSSFETNALRYRQILASNGVTLKILPSQGSEQNLQRLQDPSFNVDIGFVQAGVTNALEMTNGLKRYKLVSLGSISYQPLLIFYRAAAPVTLLSEFKGKRLAVGAEGSGSRSLALYLLQLNGIEPGGATALLDLEAGEAATALLGGTLDALFLMGDSASPQLMKQLLLNPDIHILNFTQADGYTRKISYLNKLTLPMGSLDFGKNIPSNDVYLVGPTLELLARPSLHPVLSDLLLEAAQRVHGNASLLKRKGEFPAALEHDYPISAEALRFYKSGKTFLYRRLPFGLASLVNRTLVVFVPLVILVIPGIRVLPSIFRLRIRFRIYRCYRALLALERELLENLSAQARDQLLAQLDQIENDLNKMKVPASFADQFYGLRGHIGFVRGRLVKSIPPKDGARV